LGIHTLNSWNIFKLS